MANQTTHITGLMAKGVLNPSTFGFNQDLTLPPQNIQQREHPQSELQSPRLSKTADCSVRSKLMVGLLRSWLNLTRRVTLDDTELNLLHFSLLVS